MKYFTADMHLGHLNIIRYCNRPYSNVEAMDEAIVGNWNRKVTDNDDVYILGDMAFKCNNTEEYLKQLNGKKHLIVGNHDVFWMNSFDIGKYFCSIKDIESMKLNGKEIVLCHYPLMEWKNSRNGSYHIFGHIHNVTDQNFWSLIMNNDHMLNAGVDINNYSPVSFEELIENNKDFKKDSEGNFNNSHRKFCTYSYC